MIILTGRVVVEESKAGLGLASWIGVVGLVAKLEVGGPDSGVFSVWILERRARMLAEVEVEVILGKEDECKRER